MVKECPLEHILVISGGGLGIFGAILQGVFGMLGFKSATLRGVFDILELRSGIL